MTEYETELVRWQYWNADWSKPFRRIQKERADAITKTPFNHYIGMGAFSFATFHREEWNNGLDLLRVIARVRGVI